MKTNTKMIKIKNCANPLCIEPFEYKNPKKRFCDLYCKNQAAYNYNKSNYPWEQKMQKARNSNLKILEYLINKKIYTVTGETLKKMGFDFEASFLPFAGPEKGQQIFRFENIGIVRITENEYKLISLLK